MEINLLPEAQIKKINSIKLSKRVSLLTFFLIFVCSISLGFLYYEKNQLGKKIVLIKSATIVNEKKEKIEDLERIEREVTETLALLKKAKQNMEVENQATVWSAILIDLAESFGDQAKLEKLNLDEKNKKIITVSGRAASREKVLEIKNSLENSGHFSQVISPVSNLTSQEDVNFSFSLELN